ncbi:hypothetical protein HanIR_Chr08g0343541 [Helianthus annuus]|nr:hypothetical protein HanIR_Chr08g0343541 [Helianthus annuus]
MVLQTERYNGGYQQQSYSSYQGPHGGYSNFQGVTEYTSPYSGSFQVPSYPSSHGPHHQSGWSSGGDYYGHGTNHYSGGGMIAPVKPITNGYESSYYENSYSHGNSNNHGSPNHHGGHGSPDQHGHGSPYGSGKPQGFGGAIINKMTHGHNTYGSGGPNFGHSPSGFNHGYPQHQPTWTVKALEDDD